MFSTGSFGTAVTGVLFFASVTVQGTAATSGEDRRPKYARVPPSNIEVVWQQPHKGKEIKAVLFVAHGCQHQGTDIVTEKGKDGWELSACSTSNSGSCLGLPEELRLREVARNRGYLVMAASGGSGSMSCWHPGDESWVVSAISHVYKAEGLESSVPLYALGASSGGFFVGTLARHVTSKKLPKSFPQLRCIVPQIMSIQPQRNPLPTLFVHMPKDTRTASKVRDSMEEIRKKNVVVAELLIHELPVTEGFFADHLGVQGKITRDAAKDIVEALKEAQLLNDAGLLKADPRSSAWRQAIRPVLVKHGIADGLEADRSVIAELMNVLWAKHEFSSAEASSMLDFCEDPEHWTQLRSQKSEL
eukprot:TRINITY_DN10338_c0_g1_i1.p1 TRINITY_DN10338_c0_g1~~TRINITY_DN10338_c0_g1_i1.p1  ORF type:complete len:360 (-),score=57.10 TRINITY_DN10338_c0_g1_i1:55-1134(-)